MFDRKIIQNMVKYKDHVSQQYEARSWHDSYNRVCKYYEVCYITRVKYR